MFFFFSKYLWAILKFIIHLNSINQYIVAIVCNIYCSKLCKVLKRRWFYLNFGYYAVFWIIVFVIIFECLFDSKMFKSLNVFVLVTCLFNRWFYVGSYFFWEKYIFSSLQTKLKKKIDGLIHFIVNIKIIFEKRNQSYHMRNMTKCQF